ncbi:MAG TPA: nuclear transport factor 2 family protein [Acidobacteriaceae bacterium]|jgi:ketosteroid isomerase-like protein
MRFALLLFLALQASAPSAVSNDPFGALRDQWAKDLHEKHVDDALAQYAPDADFISDTGRTHGMAALRQLFQTITSTFDSDLAFTSQRVEISGDLAYDSGTYKETLTAHATGKTQHMAGDYLTVYRRTKAANGNAVWFIVEQIWTGSEVK